MNRPRTWVPPLGGLALAVVLVAIYPSLIDKMVLAFWSAFWLAIAAVNITGAVRRRRGSISS